MFEFSDSNFCWCRKYSSSYFQSDTLKPSKYHCHSKRKKWTRFSCLWSKSQWCFKEKIESYTKWYHYLNFNEKSWYFLSTYFWLFKRNYKKCQISCDFKNGDITAVFKKAFNWSKENYRPVSTLPIILKIFMKTISK